MDGGGVDSWGVPGVGSEEGFDGSLSRKIPWCLCVLCMLLLLILSHQHLFARRRDLSGELARSVRHYMTRIWNGTVAGTADPHSSCPEV